VPGSEAANHLRQRAAVHHSGLQGVYSHLRRDARPNLTYYPQSNGKLERWHKSLKSECIRPGTPLSLGDARRLLNGYVEHYNSIRLNSAIGYVTSKDMLVGHQREIHTERDRKLAAARRQRQLRRQQAASLQS
jgi:transposase InsO family protein